MLVMTVNTSTIVRIRTPSGDVYIRVGAPTRKRRITIDAPREFDIDKFDMAIPRDTRTLREQVVGASRLGA